MWDLEQEQDPCSLRCNGCWNDCDPKEHTIATQCGHLFCLSCIQTILESDDQTCPICSQLIQKSGVKAVHVLSSPKDLRLVLAAQAPRVALEAAHASIQFYNKQQALYSEYAGQQSQRKIARTQEQCRKKLQEVHDGYLAAKRKFQEVLAQKHVLQEDNKELTEKYNQKAMQDKKLKEGFARLQQENEFLRQQVARLSGGGSVNLPASLAGMGLGGGGGGGGPGGGGGGHAMRMGVAGMEDGLGRTRPGTALGMRAAQPPPDPSPLSSRGFGGGGFGGDGGGGGGFGYDTPANQPAPMRLLHSGGGGVGRHLSGGGGLMGRQALQNDKRQSLGLGFQCAPGTSL